jgi:molybdopterin synthase sulfur carrier subunit
MVVKFFAYIRDYTKTKETKIDGCETVEVLLKELCKRYGSKFEKKIFINGELSSEIIILVNGRHIVHCNGIQTQLSSGDEVSIFPVVAGG